MNREEDVERFFSKVFIPFDATEHDCWEWTAGKCRQGYGNFHFMRKKRTAHYTSYRLFKGDTRGYQILHKCDEPSCVNPHHLFLGTAGDNMRDMTRKGRNNSALPGENHFMAKFTSQQVEEIRSLLRNKISCPTIAKLYNVGRHVIYNIASGKTYQDIAGKTPTVITI